MEKYKIIESGHDKVKMNENYDNVILHENILDILFRHQKEIHNKLIDLQGSLQIDHIAIKIIDPMNKILIFSITPSVEYNLIVQGLWKHDKSFSVNFQKENIFYSWQKAYSEKYLRELKNTKELKHGFMCGVNVSRIIGDFNLIYSFATRSKNNDLIEYYRHHINELFGLGDFGYRLIRSIYINYCDSRFDPPYITYARNNPNKSFIKLIVNNT